MPTLWLPHSQPRRGVLPPSSQLGSLIDITMSPSHCCLVKPTPKEGGSLVYDTNNSQRAEKRSVLNETPTYINPPRKAHRAILEEREEGCRRQGMGKGMLGDTVSWSDVLASLTDSELPHKIKATRPVGLPTDDNTNRTQWAAGKRLDME